MSSLVILWLTSLSVCGT